MNIFFLSSNPQEAARYHNDRHVVKMITESMQLLSTAHRILDGRKVTHGKRTFYLLEQEQLVISENAKKLVIDDPVCYMQTHFNHPSAKWVRQSVDNYLWLFSLARELNVEYKYRWNKPANFDHSAWSKTSKFLQTPPKNISSDGFTEPPQAMPDDSKVVGDSVEAYRRYYLTHKRNLANWKNRSTPDWWT